MEQGEAYREVYGQRLCGAGRRGRDAARGGCPVATAVSHAQHNSPANTWVEAPGAGLGIESEIATAVVADTGGEEARGGRAVRVRDLLQRRPGASDAGDGLRSHLLHGLLDGPCRSEDPRRE